MQQKSHFFLKKFSGIKMIDNDKLKNTKYYVHNTTKSNKVNFVYFL